MKIFRAILLSAIIAGLLASCGKGYNFDTKAKGNQDRQKVETKLRLPF